MTSRMDSNALSLMFTRRVAGKLMVLASRVDEQGGSFMYESRAVSARTDEPALRVTVTSVDPHWSETSAYLLLSCGHATEVDRDDEDSLSFLGAETTCDRPHKERG